MRKAPDLYMRFVWRQPEFAFLCVDFGRRTFYFEAKKVRTVNHAKGGRKDGTVAADFEEKQAPIAAKQSMQIPIVANTQLHIIFGSHFATHLF